MVAGAPQPSLRLPGYEVVRLIGRGGMGEVYEAIRVGPAGFRKSIAVKQLPSEKVIDGSSVQRFLQEARISAQLDHPNIVRIHDLVVQDGYFLVMELLRGWNLSEAINSRFESDHPPSWRAALEVAEQALAGLAYAHALTDDSGAPLGLVHRDLTPRNLFLTESGAVKILDFGLAKLVNALTPGLTEAGHLHGTLGFLAPEQARAERSDSRSDLYQLGGVIYWMLTNRPPNGSGSAGELLARAANSRPTPLVELRPDLPEPLLALVDRAMARAPSDRFESAGEMRSRVQAVLRDAGDLSSLIDLAAELPPVPRADPLSIAPPATAGISETLLKRDAEPTRVMRPEAVERALPWSIILIAAIALAIGFLAGELRPRELAIAPKPPMPVYQRMTFRPGYVLGARFAPDARGIVLSASWGGDPIETVLKSFDHPEIRSLGLKGSELVGIARDGKIAILNDASFIFSMIRKGTLAETSINGGAPREKLVDVQDAEWTPEGELAILRWRGARTTLELPPGNVLYDAGESAWFGELRISPDGERIALSEHPARYDDRGRIAIFDRTRRELIRPMKNDWGTIRGIAWGPDGREVWFTGAREGASRSLNAVTLDGGERLIEQVPGNLTLLDVDPKHALLSHDQPNNRVYFKAPELEERDLSWFDFDAVFDITADGSAYVFLQGGSDASGDQYQAYLRRSNGSPAVLLAPGIPWAISPDGSRVLVTDKARRSIELVPTGAGEHHKVAGLEGIVASAAWFPDGRRVLLGAEGSDRIRLLVADTLAIQELPHRGLSLPILGNPIAPDGARFAAMSSEGTLVIATLETGETAPVLGPLPGEQVMRWTPDGTALLVARVGDSPLVITRIELSNGARSRWRTLMPSDPTGVVGIPTAAFTPDLEHYVYCASRLNSTLYLVENLR